MTSAALYVRLSQEDTEGRRAGIDSIGVQTHDGSAAIAEQGWTYDPHRHLFIDDDVSGCRVTRAGWSEMLAAASRGEFTILVMRDLDRFARYEPARQMASLIDLFDRGVRVWCYVDRAFVKLSGPESIVTYARAIASEQYVESLRRNVVAGLHRRALEGRAVKAAALGYRIEDQGAKGKRWVIDPDGMQTVLRVGRTFIACGSFFGAAKILNMEGVPTPEGRGWRPDSVRVLIKRPLYRGYYEHGDLTIPHPELRIWPPEMEAEIDRILARPTKPWGCKIRHLSTRLAKCGICGGRLISTSSKRSQGTSLCCDRMRMKACEGIGYRKEAAVDQAIIAAVSLMVTDEVWARTREILRAALVAQCKEDQREAEIDRLRREVQGVERRIRGLTDGVAEAQDATERAPLLQALRVEGKRLEVVRGALVQAEALPRAEGPEAILAAAEARVEELRRTLALGGAAAAPAVEAILGEGERFTATRLDRGTWELTGRGTLAHVFVESSTGGRYAPSNIPPPWPRTWR